MKGGFTHTNFGETLAIGSSFYHKVQLKAIIDGIAVISSQEGEIKIPWTSLPLDFQRKHADQKQQMEAQAKDTALGVEKFVVQIIQVLKGGILADKMTAEYVPGPASSMARIGGGGGAAEGGFSYYPSGKIIFIQGLTGVAEGQQIEVKAYPNKVYSYRDINGASRTVEKWVIQ